MDLFDLDLGPFGAPGYRLNDRLDLSGHGSGNVAPHLNSDLIGPGDRILRREVSADFLADYRDLTHIQLPGFNGMQER